MIRAHSKLFAFLAATSLALVAAAPLVAAERGGMRQQPLDTAAGGRVPGPGPGPAVPPARSPGIVNPIGPRLPSSVPRPSMPSSIPPSAGWAITHRGTRYLVSGGQWYQRRGDELVAVAPPSGVLVSDLPEGYSMRWIGGVPYFYADGLYYVWRERPRRYEILPTPPTEAPPATP